MKDLGKYFLILVVISTSYYYFYHEGYKQGFKEGNEKGYVEGFSVAVKHIAFKRPITAHGVDTVRVVYQDTIDLSKYYKPKNQ
jgi:hypothetical protein